MTTQTAITITTKITVGDEYIIVPLYEILDDLDINRKNAKIIVNGNRRPSYAMFVYPKDKIEIQQTL